LGHLLGQAAAVAQRPAPPPARRCVLQLPPVAPSRHDDRDQTPLVTQPPALYCAVPQSHALGHRELPSKDLRTSRWLACWHLLASWAAEIAAAEVKPSVDAPLSWGAAAAVLPCSDTVLAAAAASGCGWSVAFPSAAAGIPSSSGSHCSSSSCNIPPCCHRVQYPGPSSV
jgi:hypothetical protein